MGFHFPKINAAMAMNPRPAVILREKEDAKQIESVAPANPAKHPERRTATQRTPLTLTPAESNASGCSPANCNHKPTV